ncbi:PAQR family membrane homeostasis protein TrhA [Dokdonella sp. MW10]|uniref:PAQR family membrane homeostasis protein TrhA n=1 Tax=Dokdonella sp. MW10 TaxID=2992926 RepID=UPI003F7E743A
MAPAGTFDSRITFRDELASTAIHGLGIVLSIAGLAVLVAFASLYGNAWHITASAVYGTTLILLYTASTLYHGIPNAGAKPVLQLIDHVAIFLLIAGTYTPFTLIGLGGVWGWSLFAAVWTLAIVGIAMKLARVRRHGIVVALYLGMGWIGMLAAVPLSERLGAGGMALLIAGGVSYTLGVPFYLRERMPYHHAIWHVFVLLGSVLHFFAILFHVLPDAPGSR